MLEQNYRVLINCGFFVDERLLDKGIYTTSLPKLRKFNATIEQIKDELKQYHSYIGGEYVLPVALENLSKCELVEMKAFYGNSGTDKTICEKSTVEKMNDDLKNGRHYLMSVHSDEITVEDALESFGFGRDGMLVSCPEIG